MLSYLRIIVKQYGNAFICKIEIVNENIQFKKSPQIFFRMNWGKIKSYKAQLNVWISYKKMQLSWFCWVLFVGQILYTFNDMNLYENISFGSPEARRLKVTPRNCQNDFADNAWSCYRISFNRSCSLYKIFDFQLLKLATDATANKFNNLMQ